MNKTEFVSVDFEMANNDLTSICQLGIVTYNQFEITEQWETFVNPKGEFGFYQQKVHGIKEEDVVNAPTIEDIKDRIISMFENKIVCSYGWNDFHALDRSFELPKCCWMDVSKVVNTVWFNGGKNKKTSLKNICEMKNIPLANQHNALDDALAAGTVVNNIMKEKNLNISDLLKFSMKKIEKKPLQDDFFL